MLGFPVCLLSDLYYCLIFLTAWIQGLSSNDSGGRIISQMSCELLDHAVPCYWPLGQCLSPKLEAEELQFESNLLAFVSENWFF